MFLSWLIKAHAYSKASPLSLTSPLLWLKRSAMAATVRQRPNLSLPQHHHLISAPLMALKTSFIGPKARYDLAFSCFLDAITMGVATFVL